MSYEHQFHLTMVFRETDPRAIHRAFRPLLQYFGHPWATKETFGKEPLSMDQCEVEWSGSRGSGVLTIQTSGPVSYDFVDRVRDCLAAASTLTTDRGCANLWDLETGDLPHMLTRIPFGPTERDRRLALAEVILDQTYKDLVELLPASRASQEVTDRKMYSLLYRVLPLLTKKRRETAEIQSEPAGPKPSF